MRLLRKKGKGVGQNWLLAVGYVCCADSSRRVVCLRFACVDKIREFTLLSSVSAYLYTCRGCALGTNESKRDQNEAEKSITRITVHIHTRGSAGGGLNAQ